MDRKPGPKADKDRKDRDRETKKPRNPKRHETFSATGSATAEPHRMQPVSATLQRYQELLQRWMLAAQPIEEFSVRVVQIVNICIHMSTSLKIVSSWCSTCLGMSQFY